MPVLSITKSYSDDTLLNAVDLDNIIDDVETLLNTTGLDDDNVSDESITSSSKIKTATITTAKIADEAVTTAKIADEAVTTAKIAGTAVTAAKIADDTLIRDNFYTLAPLADAGTVMMFHTFNGALSIPRGWMKCNGDAIVQSNYDSLHGSGAYAADSIATSALLGKTLPNMIGKYPRGTGDTTETGSTSISTSGNANNLFDFSHNHEISDHTHSSSLEAAQNDNDSNARGDETNTSGTKGTTEKNVTTELSSTQSIQPESIEFIYLMKVI